MTGTGVVAFIGLLWGWEALGAEIGKEGWINQSKRMEYRGRQFEIVGTPAEGIPASARRISCLKGFGSRLFLGYGGGRRHAGPLGLISYDPESGTFTRGGTIFDHVIEGMRLIEGELWIPGGEPTGGYGLGNVYQIARDGRMVRWETVPEALHVKDIAKLGSRLFCSIGAIDAQWDRPSGKIFESGDGGRRWSESLVLPAFEKIVVRADVLAVFQGALYAFGLALVMQDQRPVLRADPFGPEETWVYDGKDWGRRDLIQDPGVVKIAQAESIGDRFLLRVIRRPPGQEDEVSELYLSDGRKSRKVFGGEGCHITCFIWEGDKGYVLVKKGGGYEVHRSTDLSRFDFTLSFPEGDEPTAMASLGRNLYFGTRDGKIIRTNLP